METTASAPFDGLGIDEVINAVESLGYLSDLRVFPLNSYENRVYQVGIEDEQPLIAKFYRPERWSREQILEEHQFSLELAQAEIPVIAPIQRDNQSLFEYRGYCFSLAERKGGHAPELDNLDTLYSLGQQLGRIHAVASAKDFEYRPELSLKNFGEDSVDFLLQSDMLPQSLLPAYKAVAEQLLAKLAAKLEPANYRRLRLHGDCHPGNILCRPESLFIVDLDDCRSGPAIQDLWMLISGDRMQQSRQMQELLEGYEEFMDFDRAELRLIEPLRTLRLMHYAAWLGKRWHDPAFPQAFPWFNSERYWAEHINELKEQLYALDEESLQLQP
ncbi:serine/threonine protein kinase [Agaribacterium haliotis]|uniref:serine/threonine protein kinase n=1 Tax=Agaribacterium haliotis TaxID=2013869 RepID=UPI000BB59340|nr:serine/threonine protein kinase [Agaribacterium haliotis]